MDITYIPMARGFRLSAVCSTGSAVACCRGGCRSRWRRRFASRPCRMPWLATQAGNLQHRPGLAVHRSGLHRRACRQRHRDQHGGKGGLAGQTCSSNGYGAASNTRRFICAYDSVSEARTSIGSYLDFYNSRRPHSSLDGMTPDQAYFTPLPLRMAA